MDEQTAPKKSSFRWLPIYTVFSVLVLLLVSGISVIHLLNRDSITGADYIEGQAKDQVTIGILDNLTGVYPTISYNTDELALNNSVFEGLTILRNGRVEPALAQSWTNPDDLTWRVKLRKVNFHNGQALKASDVKYSIEETKKNSEEWTTSFIAARVDSVSVIDDQTVEIKTAAPDPTLMHWMVFLFILSEDQVKKDGVEKAVGTGPYKLVSFDPSRAELAANEDYWAGAPKVKKVVYKTYENREKQIEAMVAGEIDIAYSSTNEFDVAKVKEKDFRILKGRASDISYLGYDAMTKEDNPLADSKVRQALLLGIDIEAVIKELGRDLTPLSQFSSSDLIGFNKNLARPAVDKTKAKALLAEAGFANGFTITLDADEVNLDIANAIVKELSSIGITANVSSLSYNDFLDKVMGGGSKFYLFGYVPDTIDATDLLSAFVHSPTDTGLGAANFNSYSNADIDKSLEQASEKFETKERTKIMEGVQKKIMDELPYLPLFTRTYTYAVKESVAYNPAPFGYIFPYELSGREKAQPE